MTEQTTTVRVIHDPQRKILEILSLLRVMNNYYRKKKDIQKKVKPLVLNKFKRSLKELEDKTNWLFSVPRVLDSLNIEFMKNNDVFRFPEAIILFEAWMNLGMDAVFPRVAFNFDFPGILPGEKKRSVFQFIFNFSRGFGFPIIFDPTFYEYNIGSLKIFNPLLKWGYTVFHKANQATSGIDRRLNFNRHHPGEFESVIISEFKNGFKGIDTLLHGYKIKEPKLIGKYRSLKQVLDNVIFSYSIGDHAMSILKYEGQEFSEIPLINNEYIKRKYDVDFYPYIKKLISMNNAITERIKELRGVISDNLKGFSFVDRLRYKLRKGKVIPISENLQKTKDIEATINVLDKIRQKLWTSPLYSHTVHSRKQLPHVQNQDENDLNELEQEESDSILLGTVRKYKKKYKIEFSENKIIKKLGELRDEMAKMWLYFKERHINYAKRKMMKISSLSLDDPDYREKILKTVDNLIPIFTIHEIFIRPLSDSIYPESIPQSQKMWSYLATFLTSKYNLMGVNLIKIFNRIAYHRWSYFFKRKNIKLKHIFNFFVKLPIWENIPNEIMNFLKIYPNEKIVFKKKQRESIRDKINKFVEKF